MAAAPDRDAVAAWLVARTGRAVEERDTGELIGYADHPAIAHALPGALRAAFGPGLRATVTEVAPADWTRAWRRGIRIRRVGRLVLRPTWLPRPRAGIVLTVDPETAFGSGEHGSTRSALRLLDRWLRPRDRVLDLGSGSGILAIAAVLLGAEQAVGIETDGDALPVAQRNAERNAVSGAVQFVEGEADLLLALLAPADLVVSNILRDLNTRLLPSVRLVLGGQREGGRAIFTGMEEAEAGLFRAALAAAGLALLDEVTDHGWWAVAVRVA